MSFYDCKLDGSPSQASMSNADFSLISFCHYLQPHEQLIVELECEDGAGRHQRAEFPSVPLHLSFFSVLAITPICLHEKL